MISVALCPIAPHWKNTVWTLGSAAITSRAAGSRSSHLGWLYVSGVRSMGFAVEASGVTRSFRRSREAGASVGVATP